VVPTRYLFSIRSMKAASLSDFKASAVYRTTRGGWRMFVFQSCSVTANSLTM
jgi:hypothetical protein